MTTVLKTNPIEEAYRYLENAKQILKEKAGIDGDYYQDPKYVKMASDIAYKAMLVALDPLLPKKKRGQRRDVEDYRNFIAKQNRKLLKIFNEAYLKLHLYGGYDGGLSIKAIKEGLKEAEQVINWAKQRLGY